MRPVTFNDLTAVATVLLATNEAQRETLCSQIFRRAELADAYTRRLGKPHPVFGRGSLGDVAALFVETRRSTFKDATYCDCFQLVLTYLQRRRDGVM